MSLYIGYTTATDPVQEDFVDAPKAPSNWKDANKIIDYEVAARAKAVEESANKPLTGAISDMAVLCGNLDKYEVLELKGKSRLAALQKHISEARVHSDAFAKRPLIFVTKPSLFLRLLIIEHFNTVKEGLARDMLWTVRSEVNSYPYMSFDPDRAPRVVDPIRALVGSQAEGLGWVAAAKRFGIEVVGANAVAQAIVIKGLARVFGG